MNDFTLEELQPSEFTLLIVRKIARTYRVNKKTGKAERLCLN